MSATNRGDERGILQQTHYPDQPALAFATPQSGLPPSTPTIAAQIRTSLLNSVLTPSPENSCNTLSNPPEQFLKSTRPNDTTPQVEMPSKISKAQNPVAISKAPMDNSLIYSNATPKPYITKPSTIVSAAIDQSTGKQKITSKPGHNIQPEPFSNAGSDTRVALTGANKDNNISTTTQGSDTSMARVGANFQGLSVNHSFNNVSKMKPGAVIAGSSTSQKRWLEQKSLTE
ncbi:hypothetical protein B0J14DRAFT_608424 [Halenospora varia]|nr:hypothetical protein B0J14DRAFT_608424 [Halenospora varia]